MSFRPADDVLAADITDLALALWRADDWPKAEGIDPWLARFGLGMGREDPFSPRNGVVSGEVRAGAAVRVERTLSRDGALAAVGFTVAVGKPRGELERLAADVVGALQTEVGAARVGGVGRPGITVAVVRLPAGAVVARAGEEQEGLEVRIAVETENDGSPSAG